MSSTPRRRRFSLESSRFRPGPLSAIASRPTATSTDRPMSTPKTKAPGSRCSPTTSAGCFDVTPDRSNDLNEESEGVTQVDVLVPNPPPPPPESPDLEMLPQPEQETEPEDEDEEDEDEEVRSGELFDGCPDACGRRWRIHRTCWDICTGGCRDEAATGPATPDRALNRRVALPARGMNSSTGPGRPAWLAVRR